MVVAKDEGQQWLATLLSAVREGIVATDHDGFVRFMNPAAEKLTGWRQSEAMGKELSTVFRTAPLSTGAPSQERPVGDTDQVQLVQRSGATIPIEVTAAAVNDDRGRITGFVWAFRDITSRRRVEEALRDSEAHFRSLIEQASDIIAVVDQDGMVYYASPSVQHALGYNPVDILGQNAFEIVDPADTARAVRALTSAPAGSQPGATELRLRHSDGSWRIFEAVSTQPVEDPSGSRFVINARDITERKEAEAKLHDELELSDALARVGRAMIAASGTRGLLDRLGEVTTEVLKCDFSHTWMRETDEPVYNTVAGYGDSPEQWESMRALKVPHSVIGGLLERLEKEEIAEVVMAQQQSLLPATLPAKYGITVAIYIALRRGGEIVGVQTAGYRGRQTPFSPQQRRIGVAIGRLASLALEQVRLIEELERAHRLQSNLVATLSQELKSPLASTVTVAERLIERGFPDDAELQTIRSSCAQMLQLVSTTLDLSRIGRRRVPVATAEVKPAALLEEIAAESIHYLQRPGVRLAWDVAPNMPALRTDRLKLKVVLSNVIGNALKFTERGSVRVSARSSQSGVEFDVSDTGVGISLEAREAIFEPLQQLDPERAETQGIGIGLYIARRLLEILGGRVSVQSTPGQGSVFRIWLPLDVPGAEDRH